MKRFQAAYYVDCESIWRKTPHYYNTPKEAWEALKKIAKREGLDHSRLGEMPNTSICTSNHPNPKKDVNISSEDRDNGKIRVQIIRYN